MSGMTKVGTGAKLEDSNIAAYGSKEHKDAKLAAAQSEPAWAGAGQAPGIRIWRIEKFKVKDWAARPPIPGEAKDNKQFGKFYDGDSYIVLHTYKHPEKEALLFNVHFWLGAHSTQDEMGTAAYKTVELDDLLGDVPVQYREVQGSESDEFLALFPEGVKLLSGGVESGFNKVKPDAYKPKLLHVKGKKAKKIRVVEVPLDAKSLNAGDTFILDAGLKLYQWNGPSAGMFEKRKGGDILQDLKNSRNHRPVSRIIDGLEEDEEFWKLFGGRPGTLAPATDDDVKISHNRQILKLSDATGTLESTKVWEGDAKTKIDLCHFNHDDVFIVDLGDRIAIWVGRGASKEENRKSMQHGVDHLHATGRPNNTQLTRVTDAKEPGWFKECCVGAIA